MLRPELIWEEHKDQVAVMVSFVPTFQHIESNSEGVFVGRVPKSTTQINGEEFFYVFLVDHISSMGGQRVEITKDALKLFMHSLPPKCKFQIISYGTGYSMMGGEQAYFEYNQESMEKALGYIDALSENMSINSI